jgi:hypothetical protein
MTLFMAAALGGFVGGISCGVFVVVVLATFGRAFAERFVRAQAGWIERELRTRVVDGALARISSFLEQSERIGQIAKRVVEIVQLMMRGPLPPEPVTGAPLGGNSLARAHATMGTALAALGRFDDARRAFEEALRLDPHEPTARAGLTALDAATRVPSDDRPSKAPI